MSQDYADERFSDFSDDELAEYKAKVIGGGAAESAAEPEHAPESSARFHFVRIGDLQVSAPQWLVKGLIERESFALLFGESSAGKSFVALDLAACIATGTRFHGHEIRMPGPVAYVAGEGHQGLARRLAAWRIRNGVALEDAPLFVSNTATALCDDASAEEVETAIKDCEAAAGKPPVLVVVDTWSRNLGGDENSSLDGSVAVRTLDRIRARWGCTVMVVHHVGHADRTRARGWSGLKAAVDTEYRVERGPDDVIRVEASKTKDGRTPVPMAFALHDVDLGFQDEDGQEVRSAILDDVDFVPVQVPKEPTVKNQRQALEVLEAEYVKCWKNIKASGRDPERMARMDLRTWGAACQKVGMARSSFYHAKNSLLETGSIRIDGDFVIPSGFPTSIQDLYEKSLAQLGGVCLSSPTPLIGGWTLDTGQDAASHQDGAYPEESFADD